MNPTQPPRLTTADRIRQLSQARQRVLNAPAQQAMVLIFDHPQPAALVHSIADEDLHFMIQDIGPDNALPLLALASNRQWEYLVDMQVWNRDRLDYQQATTWLQLLLQADPQRLAKWCFDEKLEFLELFLFRNIEARIREPEQAPSDFGDGFFSDDDTYYVRLVDYPVSTGQEASIKTLRNEMLTQLLSRLSLYDHPRYQGLLLESAGVIPGEIEEELYRLRNVRLGEKGFLPFDEAIGVYQPLGPGGLAARGRKIIRPPSAEDIRVPVPQFAAAFLEGDDLFVRALKGIAEAHVVQQLQVELAGLCNQVITADQEIIRGRDQLHKVVAKVSGYLSIGLEEMLRGTKENLEAQASSRLRRHLLADIFRTGFSGALQLKWRATRWRKESWFQAQGLALTFWDQMWLGMLGGLLIDQPKCYTPDHAGSSYHDFRTLAEIEAAALELDRVTALDRLFERMPVTITQPAKDRLLTYKNLLLTLWCRAQLKLPPVDAGGSPIAIPTSAFEPFFKALWTTGEDGRRFIDDTRKMEFLKWAANASDESPADLSDRLGMVFEALFDEIERETASVKPGNLDPRYIQLFILKP